jgi:hypothetical protein
MDLNATIQSWMNVLTHPGEAAFAEERSRPQAKLETALIWIVIAAVVGGILGWIQVQLFLGSTGGMAAMIEQMDLPPEVAEQMNSMMSSGMMDALMGGSGLASIIITPISFLIGTGILYLIARLFGGTGDFGRFAYLLAAFQAPIAIISAVLGLVPFLGGCLAAALSIYSIVLTYFAIKVEHSLSGGKAIATLLLPLILVLVIAFCGAAAIAGLLVSMQGN